VTVTTMVNLPPAALDRIFRASTLGSPKIQVPTFGDGVIVFEPSAGTAVPGVIFLDDDQPEPGLEGQLILDPTDIAAGVLVGLAVGGGVGAVAGIGFVLGRQGLRLLARVLARRAEKTPQGAQDKRFPALSELREREEGSVMMCCRLAGEPSRPALRGTSMSSQERIFRVGNSDGRLSGSRPMRCCPTTSKEGSPDKAISSIRTENSSAMSLISCLEKVN
jgi:hypothetical protein